jgi:hypothetical protein
MEVSQESNTSARRCNREEKDSLRTKPTHRQATKGRREALVCGEQVRLERQHDKYDSCRDGNPFAAHWPFTRVEGKRLEEAHKAHKNKTTLSVGEALW